MALIRVIANTQDLRKKLRRLRIALTPEAQDKVMRRIAEVWRGRMVLRTPKRWTGLTRKAWAVRNSVSTRGGAAIMVVNTSKTMVFLERGTKAHGPKNAKRLFVPLTRRAAQAGPRVVVQELIEARAAKRKPKFRAGRDFVFAKRVRGIRPMWIVRDALPFMRLTARASMRQFIQAVLSM
jgi:hypothetical protein